MHVTSLRREALHAVYLTDGAILAALKAESNTRGVIAMAELDKDRPGVGSSYGRPSSPGDETTWTAGAGNSASMGGSGNTGQSFDQTKEQAKQRAAEMAQQAKEQGRQMFAGQKDKAAGQVDSVARALRSTADQMSAEEAQTGRYVGLAAEQLESFGQRLREKDVDDLLHDAQNLARRSPMAFFAGSVAAGFLLSRFLKSSSDKQADPERYSGQRRMTEGFQRMKGDEDSGGTRASYMDTGAEGSMADTGASSVELRTTTRAPDGGSTETSPLPTGDTTRGGSYGL